eukprot:m.30495 g.30495  ORF g.30495 m.30495 type:complete len:442 (-) comp9246_c0_seq1:86-1411(-)
MRMLPFWMSTSRGAAVPCSCCCGCSSGFVVAAAAIFKMAIATFFALFALLIAAAAGDAGLSGMTIAQVMDPTSRDDGAPYYEGWFNEAPLGAPTTATGYFLTDAAKNDGAVCLDGTPGVYYHRKGTGTGANKWFIHHQGGGWCESLESCYGRALGALGSSRTYPATASLGEGYFSTNSSVNPQMYNWNAVLLRYCDGNSFSGTNSTLTPYKNLTLHFRGKHILEAVINSLLTDRGLDHATDVVISGSSAGGLATFIHCDHWHGRVTAATRAKLVCMPDSGFFLDYQGTPQYHSGMIWAFYQQNSTSGVNQDCIASNVGQEWKCMFAPNTAPHVKTPLFALQSQYDSWQVKNDLDSTNTTVINAWGKTLTSLVKSNLLANPIHGVFLDSCLHHCGLWGSIRIDGQIQAQAFGDWYAHGSASLPNKGFFNQNKPYKCDACCHA